MLSFKCLGITGKTDLFLIHSFSKDLLSRCVSNLCGAYRWMIGDEAEAQAWTSQRKALPFHATQALVHRTGPERRSPISLIDLSKGTWVQVATSQGP